MILTIWKHKEIVADYVQRIEKLEAENKALAFKVAQYKKLYRERNVNDHNDTSN